MRQRHALVVQRRQQNLDGAARLRRGRKPLQRRADRLGGGGASHVEVVAGRWRRCHQPRQRANGTDDLLGGESGAAVSRIGCAQRAAKRVREIAEDLQCKCAAAMSSRTPLVRELEAAEGGADPSPR